MADLALHPEFLVKNGKREFVVLPYEEFEALQEVLADASDLIDLRDAKETEGDAPTVSLEEVKRQLGLSALDLAEDLVGSVEDGTSDLATNPEHLNGYGKEETV